MNVGHVPDLAVNLLAVNIIAEKNSRTVLFDETGCRVVNQQVKVDLKSVIGTASGVNGLYRLESESFAITFVCCNANKFDELVTSSSWTS